jgi:hypothetical protein
MLRLTYLSDFVSLRVRLSSVQDLSERSKVV